MPQTIEQFDPNLQLMPKEFPELAKKMSGKFGASLTLAKGTVIAIKTSDSKLYAYNDANSDGTQVARGILNMSIKTDASGNVYFGNESAVANVRNVPFPEAPYYFKGVFDTADLTGYDAAALVDFGGRTLRGTLIYIP